MSASDLRLSGEPLHLDAAVGPLEVVGAGLEQVRGDLDRLVLDALPTAPSTAPASITVVRLPPGPVAGSPLRVPA